jgi:2-iminobutanoate/2-iminopropanoate deaminase
MRLALARRLLPLAALALAACAPRAASTSTAPRAEFGAASANAPLSQYVRVGETIYLAGVLGTDAASGGALVPGGIVPETRKTLENMRERLARAGATMDDVVSCTVYLADYAEWPAMNEVYATFFPRNKPARTAVAVSGLARNARVEITCVAVRGAGAIS